MWCGAIALLEQPGFDCFAVCLGGESLAVQESVDGTCCTNRIVVSSLVPRVDQHAKGALGQT